MIGERTNSIQIIEYFLIDYNNKIPSKTNIIKTFPSNTVKKNSNDIISKEMMESSRQNQDYFNKLIEKSQQEFNVEKTIRQYKENIEKINKEMNERRLIQEENHKKFVQQMIIPDDNIKKNEEEMQKDLEKRKNELEERKNKE